MEGREKAHTDKYRENMNDWNYNKSRMFTSLVLGLETFW
jgi:hypothetical protein